MAEVLVLVDHVDGAVRKTTLELLTIAARLGEPSAVFLGDGLEQARETLAEYGAAKVYAVSADVLGDYLVAPKAEVLAQLVEQAGPAAVLIASSSEGKEIAARLAIKTGSGVITDAVDVQAGDVRSGHDPIGLRGLLHRAGRGHHGHAHHHGQAELRCAAGKPGHCAGRRRSTSPSPTRPRAPRSPSASRARRPAGPS